MDNFNEKITESNQIIKSLLTDLRQRQILTKESKPTIHIESTIRGNLIKLDSNISSLKNSILTLNRSQLSIQEVNRRNKLVQDIQNNYTNIKRYFEKSIIPKTDNQNDITSHKEATEKYSDMSDQEVVLDFKQQIKEQDEGLDVLHSVLKNNRGITRQMNDEVQYQNKQLGEIDGLMDDVKYKIKNTNTKLDDFTKRGSNWFLIMIIFMELILLVLVTFIL